jgi:hypothetical protein
MIGPAIALAAILALFHVSAYVFVRGKAGARVPLLLLAAFLGAWAGDAIATRLDLDPVRIGDFHLLAASVVAWAAIGIVVLLTVMAPARSAPPSATPSASEPVAPA